jgi:hypothetical protein
MSIEAYIVIHRTEHGVDYTPYLMTKDEANEYIFKNDKLNRYHESMPILARIHLSKQDYKPVFEDDRVYGLTTLGGGSHVNKK